jgi:hypothetical protein
MANPNGNITWLAGGASPNPLGSKLTQRTIAGAVSRFLKRNLTSRKLQQLHDSLQQPKEKLFLLLALLPYELSKKADQTVSREEIEEVRQMLEIKSSKHG